MIKIIIHTDNAAFRCDDGEGGDCLNITAAAEAVRQAADKIQAGHDGGKLFDANGNSAGRFDITE